jgi:hypothetical protein
VQAWRLTADFVVLFNDNPIEQPQRMVDLRMKIGGSWRSVHTGARCRLIRSYLGTIRHHGTFSRLLGGRPGHSMIAMPVFGR